MDRVADRKDDQGRQGRMVALVVVATAVLWLILNWVAEAQGWSRRTLGLIDLAALAGFLWALIVTWQIWRKRRDNG